jgi:hypothetical protein
LIHAGMMDLPGASFGVSVIDFSPRNRALRPLYSD